MPPTSFGKLTPDELEHIATRLEAFANFLRASSTELRRRSVKELWVHQVASLNRAYRDTQRFQVKLEDSLRQLAKGTPYGPPAPEESGG